MKTIGGFFGRSPYGPVHEMMLKIQQCLEAIPALLAAEVAGDWDALQAAGRQIDAIEGQADDIKREIRRHLSASLFSSVQRAETLSLVHSLDEIADAAQDAAKLMVMRRTPLPRELAAGLAGLGEKLVGAGRDLTGITARLAGATPAGAPAGHQDIQGLLAELEAVGRIEAECDALQQGLLAALFAREGNGPGAVDIFFLMNIIKELGRIADETENAADCLAAALGSR